MKLNKLKLLIGSLLLTAVLMIVPSLQAQEVESVQENASNTTDTLRERIEKIVEQQRENVETVLSGSDRRRGFVAQVIRVSQETLTVDSRGINRVVALAEAELMEGDEAIEPDEIAIDDWVLVLGLNNNDVFTPKKITLLSASPRPNQHLVQLGAIKEINTRSMDFQARGQEEVAAVSLTNQTEYQNNQGEEAELEDFLEDDQVLLIGYLDEDETIVTVIRALAPFDRGE